MKLAAVDVIFLDCCSEQTAVFRVCDDRFITVGSVKGVDEINAVTVFDIFKNRTPLRSRKAASVFGKNQVIPSDVRYLVIARYSAFH